MADNDRYLIVKNYTNFFNRELFMYSLGDIKFKKPISLKKVGYTTVFIILWTIPNFYLIGFPTGLFSGFYLLGIPLIAGHFAAKPVFGGKGLLDYLKALKGYLSEPAGWTDLNPMKRQGAETFFTEKEIWISRRREIQALSEGRLEEL